MVEQAGHVEGLNVISLAFDCYIGVAIKLRASYSSASFIVSIGVALKVEVM